MKFEVKKRHENGRLSVIFGRYLNDLELLISEINNKTPHMTAIGSQLVPVANINHLSLDKLETNDFINSINDPRHKTTIIKKNPRYYVSELQSVVKCPSSINASLPKNIFHNNSKYINKDAIKEKHKNKIEMTTSHLLPYIKRSTCIINNSIELQKNLLSLSSNKIIEMHKKIQASQPFNVISKFNSEPQSHEQSNNSQLHVILLLTHLYR